MNKKIRILLRVSSNQQLEADGDLTVQRQLVLDYVKKQEDWTIDSKEYFEGSNSGYKNTVADRDTLQEALKDAENGDYDILVAYKDDRVGRRMWEIGTYVMQLKQCGVDIYTVKDGCISPQADDIMGQMILALRYGTAQKSSSDTGMRVKDTAQKLVQQGKFMGGKAPYGYELIFSGEISKHGRALKKLQVIEEQAEVVKHIYELSVTKEYGSSKIAKELNFDEKYKKMVPKDYWKGGTITSILTNPIYAGYVSYKRRERVNGKIHRLDDSEWIKSNFSNDEIRIIDENLWNHVQEKRKKRSLIYTEKIENKDINIILNNSGKLSLIDVAYCGYCGGKLTNGTKYNYWTIKDTGEKRASLYPVYRCQNAQNGVPHDISRQFRAEKIEPIVFKEITAHIDEIQRNQSMFTEINKSYSIESENIKASIKAQEQEIKKTLNGISVMETHIPDAMLGTYALTIEELADAIRKHKDMLSSQNKELVELKNKLVQLDGVLDQRKEIENFIHSWKDVFNNSDIHTKRVLINKIVKRIDMKVDEITISYAINLSNFKKL